MKAKQAKFYVTKGDEWDNPGVTVDTKADILEKNAGELPWLCRAKFREVFGFLPRRGQVFEITFTPKIRKVK